MATGTVSFVEKEKTIVVKEKEPRIRLDLSVEEALYIQLVIGRMSGVTYTVSPYFDIRAILCKNNCECRYLKGEFIPKEMIEYIEKEAKIIKEKLCGQS